MKLKSEKAQIQRALFDPTGELDLVSLAFALGASKVGPDHSVEAELLAHAVELPHKLVESVRHDIKSGNDPLGDRFSAYRSSTERRGTGATYTPKALVESILFRIREEKNPSRIIDAGCGSGRFLVECGKLFPNASLIGFDIDPLATLMAKANIACHGYENRTQIMLQDYCSATLSPIEGQSIFVGNPPYVRHHQIHPERKEWLIDEALRLGYRASALAGLHVYFYLSTVIHGKPGDRGAFITSSEWLDVNYGSLVRELFLGYLGGDSITVIEPTAEPFPETATTATVTSFAIGTKPEHIKVARVEEVAAVKNPCFQIVKRERFATEKRWSHLTRVRQEIPEGFIELGELCRVHRGSVTGANKIWIAGDHSTGLPEDFQYPTVTRAKELFDASSALIDPGILKKVIDLPEDFSGLDQQAKKSIEKFLRFARAQSADEGYIARTRKAWWSVGLRRPAPILATYMARRPPKFVLNKAEARHINIAHGLYPREELSEDILSRIAKYLCSSVSVDSGRTYAGGLTKFEPREMERLLIPRPEEIVHFIK